MSVTISQTETDLFAAVQAFLQSILPPGTPIFKGQANRVPEPSQPDFVEITPLLRTRLETDTDTYADCAFTGSIDGSIMVVSAITLGTIGPGAPLFGPTVLPGSSVTASRGGNGGIGAYAVAPPQTVASGPLAAGTKQVQQNTMATVQCDVHGPASADSIQKITTLWRNDYACQFFAAALPGSAPCYTSEPRQMPFINAEAQYEYRWTTDLLIQVNPVVGVPQQFADVLEATLPPPVDA